MIDLETIIRRKIAYPIRKHGDVRTEKDVQDKVDETINNFSNLELLETISSALEDFANNLLNAATSRD